MGPKKWRTQEQISTEKVTLANKDQIGGRVKTHVQINCDDRKDPYQSVTLANRDQHEDTKPPRKKLPWQAKNKQEIVDEREKK